MKKKLPYFKNRIMPVRNDWITSYSILDAENKISELLYKCGNLEKSKQELQTNLDDLQVEFDRVSQNSSILEKRTRNFDKIILEWKSKADDLRIDLEECRKQQRYEFIEVMSVFSHYRRKTVKLTKHLYQYSYFSY